MKILIATDNPHKLKELTNMLPAKLKNGTPIEYVSLADFNGLVLPPETGSTLEDNAEIKAVYAARESGLPAVSDDTGLEVKFLHGAPGVHTARYAARRPGRAASARARGKLSHRGVSGHPAGARPDL